MIHPPKPPPFHSLSSDVVVSCVRNEALATGTTTAKRSEASLSEPNASEPVIRGVKATPTNPTMRTIDRTHETGNGKENKDVSDFMTDGSVDPQKVKGHLCGQISKTECRQWRRRIREADRGYSVNAMIREDDIEWKKDTVREHIKGWCTHTLDEPPLEYDGGGWVVADDSDS